MRIKCAHAAGFPRPRHAVAIAFLALLSGSAAHAQRPGQLQAMNEAALMEFADAHCPELKVNRAAIEFDLKMSGVDISKPAVAQYYEQYKRRVLSTLKTFPTEAVCAEALREVGPYDFIHKVDASKPPQPAQSKPPATPSLPASKVGAWSIGTKTDNRPFAVSDATVGEMWLKQLRIECVAGGRLEYVPVPGQNEPVKALWLDVTFDPIKITHGRIAGAAASQLSKLFLKTEVEAQQANAGGDWSVGLILNDQNRMSSTIIGDGFSKMRSELLEHCKS